MPQRQHKQPLWRNIVWQHQKQMWELAVFKDVIFHFHKHVMSACKVKMCFSSVLTKILLIFPWWTFFSRVCIYHFSHASWTQHCSPSHSTVCWWGGEGEVEEATAEQCTKCQACWWLPWHSVSHARVLVGVCVCDCLCVCLCACYWNRKKGSASVMDKKRWTCLNLRRKLTTFTRFSFINQNIFLNTWGEKAIVILR